jgi:hypothetical protein
MDDPDVATACDSNHSRSTRAKRVTQVVLVAIIALLVRCLLNLTDNPLANGRIPALEFGPNEHWKRMKEDDLFVRSMTEHLGKSAYRSAGKALVHSQNNAYAQFDIGGPDGHKVEDIDWSGITNVQGTRCSATRSAITAYFCGSQVAENQDQLLSAGATRKDHFFGIQSFAMFLQCQHDRASRLGTNHRRAVYRIGIDCKDVQADYAHAFSIIAQPDGSFFWLQSFGGHYSLQQWMAKTNENNAHLTLPELLHKLDQIARLQLIQSWTPQANQDYLELFGVDKDAGSGGATEDWTLDRRLDYFAWDEACEYPLAHNNATTNPATAASMKTKPNNDPGGTECHFQMLPTMMKEKRALPKIHDMID